MQTTTNLSTLLTAAGLIVQHQKDLERVRGEKFNIFTILGMERSENATHSAFLGELLNPRGSHLQGNLFLKLFLEQIGHQGFDAENAWVKLEHYIGVRDDTAKTGGRIDIYLWDKNGQSISIENKIYAIDQYAQVERYYKHNQAKNRVYYLTLFGVEPSPDSKGTLLNREHFEILGYNSHIVEWLQVCIKESAEMPLLRETIKQYLLLIKKLTGLMDNKLNDELSKLIIANYESAYYIETALPLIKLKKTEDIRQQVIERLRQELDPEIYTVAGGGDTSKTFSQIWVHLNGLGDARLHFGIESFSGKGQNNGNLFVGICTGGSKAYADHLKIEASYGNYWVNPQGIPALDNMEMHLGNPETLHKLFNDSNFLERFVTHIVEETKKYIVQESVPLIAYIKSLPIQKV